MRSIKTNITFVSEEVEQVRSTYIAGADIGCKTRVRFEVYQRRTCCFFRGYSCWLFFFFFFIIAVDYSQKYQIKSWNELGICDKLSRIHRELHIVNLDNISWKQYNISSPNWRLFSNS